MAVLSLRLSNCKATLLQGGALPLGCSTTPNITKVATLCMQLAVWRERPEGVVCVQRLSAIVAPAVLEVEQQHLTWLLNFTTLASRQLGIAGRDRRRLGYCPAPCRLNICCESLRNCGPCWLGKHSQHADPSLAGVGMLHGCQQRMPQRG